MNNDLRRVATNLKLRWENAPVVNYQTWEFWDGMARHALLSIREPSKAMLSTGLDARDDGGSYEQVVWQSMIDAALEEG